MYVVEAGVDVGVEIGVELCGFAAPDCSFLLGFQRFEAQVGVEIGVEVGV